MTKGKAAAPSAAARRRVVVLVSGADSEILTTEFLSQGWTVWPLYVRCGFVWESAELSRLRSALRALKSPRLRPLTVSRAPVGPFMRGHWSVTGRGVPGARSRDEAVLLPERNAVLLTQAWLHAVSRGVEAVAIGTLKGNPFPDATPEFRSAIQRALNLGFHARIRLLAPYAGLAKAQVLRRAGQFRLELAFSCLRPIEGRACGACNKCSEWAAALRSLPQSPKGERLPRPVPEAAG